MMDMYYKLNEDKSVSPCDLLEWAQQREVMSKTYTKHVAEETIGDRWISTVWLGVDHGIRWSDKEDYQPLIFETMIHNNKTEEWEDYEERYSTWADAVSGHKRAVEWVKNGLKMTVTKDQQVKNILAFLAILFGESDLWQDEIMHFRPDYLLEKFSRYIESTGVESPWGLHPTIRRSAFNRYLDKWKIEHDDT
jgi:hypothetical protein